MNETESTNFTSRLFHKEVINYQPKGDGYPELYAF